MMDGTSSAGRPGLYETSDFYLACFLRCSGYELAGLRRDGRRCVFAYRDRPTRQRDILAFYGDRAAVVPLRFVGAIKDVPLPQRFRPLSITCPGFLTTCDRTRPPGGLGEDLDR